MDGFVLRFCAVNFPQYILYSAQVKVRKHLHSCVILITLEQLEQTNTAAACQHFCKCAGNSQRTMPYLQPMDKWFPLHPRKKIAQLQTQLRQGCNTRQNIKAKLAVNSINWWLSLAEVPVLFVMRVKFHSEAVRTEKANILLEEYTSWLYFTGVLSLKWKKLGSWARRWILYTQPLKHWRS